MNGGKIEYSSVLKPPSCRRAKNWLKPKRRQKWLLFRWQLKSKKLGISSGNRERKPHEQKNAKDKKIVPFQWHLAVAPFGRKGWIKPVTNLCALIPFDAYWSKTCCWFLFVDPFKAFHCYLCLWLSSICNRLELAVHKRMPAVWVTLPLSRGNGGNAEICPRVKQCKLKTDYCFVKYSVWINFNLNIKPIYLYETWILIFALRL